MSGRGSPDTVWSFYVKTNWAAPSVRDVSGHFYHYLIVRVEKQGNRKQGEPRRGHDLQHMSSAGLEALARSVTFQLPRHSQSSKCYTLHTE